MSANKRYAEEFRHRAMPGERRAAQTKSVLKRMSSRYTRREMKRDLDEVMSEVSFEKLEQQRDREIELHRFRQDEVYRAWYEEWLDSRDGAYEDDFDFVEDWDEEPPWASRDLRLDLY